MAFGLTEEDYIRIAKGENISDVIDKGNNTDIINKIDIHKGRETSVPTVKGNILSDVNYS